MNIPTTSHMTIARKGILGVNMGLRWSSSSSRSSKAKSFGVFSLPFSSSILPNPIRSLLFDTEAENESKSVDDSSGDGQIEEEVDKDEKVKRAN